MRVPSSTPAGTWTSSVRSLTVRPLPWHLEQGSVMTCPVPAQREQVRATLKKPCW